MEITSTLFLNNAKIANRFWNTPLGKIEEGAAGDIVLIDYESPTPLDENTYLGHLVFGISQSTVDTTIVDGNVLMENKILKLDIDEEEVSRKALECADALWKRF
jgi:cytosine/adenosine deaminase-related metal-dependent hydrolase